MKTVKMDGRSHRGFLIVLMLIAMAITWWGCSKPTTPIDLGTPIEVSPAERYIGFYEREDALKTITISHPTTILPDGEFTKYEVIHQVYISNLVNGVPSTVLADWGGSAFIIDEQVLEGHQHPMKISGQVSLREEELTVSLHLDSGKSQTSRTEKYYKIR